jgi:murein L,D-transpeptidase YcbB/YkuD
VLLVVGLAAPAPADDAMAETARLAAAAARYREVAAHGGWQPVPSGPAVHPGERHPMVPAVRARLTATGDLLAAGSLTAPADVELYDDGLAAGVRAFQGRHGLASDGVIGARTRLAMNVPVGERVAQLDLNRTRLEEEVPPADRYIRVNLPDFRLELIEGERTVLDMPVVIGRRDRRTPFIETAVTWIVFNPTWTVPTKLAYEDVLPKVRRDPHYLAKIGIQVYDGWESGAHPIDPSWIEWKDVGVGMKRLKLRQAPGPDNPLGRIKFHMDNDQDIYLHDTNHRDLMAKDRRDLSSGCIRVGNAEGLARELLRDQPRWPPERIDQALAGKETIRVPLRRPVPVRFAYQTAWVDGQDTVHFREDIYDVDARRVVDLGSLHRSQPRPAVSQAAPAAPPLGGQPATGVSPPAP